MRWLEKFRSPASLVAVAYVVLVAAYSQATPLYESTDEIRHFRYIRYLQTYRALPEQTGDPARNAQAHHPPVYYLVAAVATAWVPLGPSDPVFFEQPVNPFWGYRYFEVGIDNKAQYLHGPDEAWPYRGNAAVARLARLISGLFGLGVVLATYRLGQVAFPNRPAIALGGAAFVAFNPNFLHLAGSISNDVPAAFFGALALLASARIWRDGNTPKAALFLGLALALGLMTKTNTIALLVPGLLAIGHRARRDRAWRPALVALGLVAGCLIVISGGWFVRNQVLYGDWTGAADYVALWRGEADQARLVREMISNLPYAGTTLWGRFGYGQAPLPTWVYWTGGVTLGVAGVGWLAAVTPNPLPLHNRTLSGEGIGDRGWGLLLAAALLASLAAWVALMVTIPATANARMIFAAYPALGLLVARGLAGWVRVLRPERRPAGERWAAYGLAGGVLALACLALFGYLRPAFGPPRFLNEARVRQEATPAEASLAGVAEIVGYRVSVGEGLAGQPVDVTVYWRPLATTVTPWTVFVHLLDDDGIPIAQRQTYPGLGNYPTTAWQPGRIFADTYRVWIPDTAYSPNHGQWRVGLFDLTTGERLAVFDANGVQVSDSLSLGAFDLRARPGSAPNSSQVNFGGGVALVGYELDRRTAAPGDTIELTAYWRGLNVESDYWAYAHVVGTDGSIWANSDSVILPPATAWQPGELIRETRSLRLAADTPPGLYEIEFGVTLVDEAGQHRLPILAEGGHETGDHLVLTTIKASGD